MEEPKKEDPLIHMIKLGILNQQRGEYKKAESILHAALKIAQERVDFKGETYVYDVLANVALESGDYPKAEKLFTEVMRRVISTGTQKDDNAIVEMSLKLARIYSHRNEEAKAEQGFRFCIDTQGKKMESIDMSDTSKLSDLERDTVLLWAMSMDHYGRHHLKYGRLKEAQDCISRALKVCEDVNGRLHEQTLVLLNDLATIATRKGDYVTATELVRDAIARGKECNTPDLPTFYCNLCAILVEEDKDLQSARKACIEALIIAKKAKHAAALKEAQKRSEELRSSEKKSCSAESLG